MPRPFTHILQASRAEHTSAQFVGAVLGRLNVCALPVERARRLWTRPILAADPTFAGMFELKTDWMNGIRVYLRQSPPLAHGHIACVTSPWKLSGILQAQFWACDFASSYGDVRALDCFSPIVSAPDHRSTPMENSCSTSRPTSAVADRHQLQYFNDTSKKMVELLTSLGVDYGQGFHLGRPAPAEQQGGRWSQKVGGLTCAEPLPVSGGGSSGSRTPPDEPPERPEGLKYTPLK